MFYARYIKLNNTTKQLRDVESLNAFFIIPALSRDTLSRLFSTHLPVEERVRRLREMASMLK